MDKVEMSLEEIYLTCHQRIHKGENVNAASVGKALLRKQNLYHHHPSLFIHCRMKVSCIFPTNMVFSFPLPVVPAILADVITVVDFSWMLFNKWNPVYDCLSTPSVSSICYVTNPFPCQFILLLTALYIFISLICLLSCLLTPSMYLKLQFTEFRKDFILQMLIPTRQCQFFFFLLQLKKCDFLLLSSDQKTLKECLLLNSCQGNY